MHEHAPLKEPGLPLPAPVPSNALDPERWVDEHGDALLRFALARVRDAALAEDLVQETFLTALKHRQNFRGLASEKTWLIGILRNKVLQHFRKAARETTFTDLEFFAGPAGDTFQHEGRQAGKWHPEAQPADWEASAAAHLDQEAFSVALRECLSRLPERVGGVFALREMEGLETDEICGLLHITPNNLWVMLHRARLALRRCLESKWLKTRPSTA